SSLRIAERIGAKGVIFHTGSHKGLGLDAVFEQICTACINVLAEVPGDELLIFENSAGQGGTIGSKFHDLGEIVRRVDNPRVKVCIDTCHAFAAGYDLTSAEGVVTVIDELEEEIGVQKVAAIPWNDSTA